MLQDRTFRNSGFTLVELVIVMAVIAIIMSFIFSNVRGLQQEGELTRAEQELQTLKTAVTSYWKNNNSTYPADIVATLTSASPQVVTAELKDPWTTNADGVTYGYSTGNDADYGEYFIIWTQGPNRDTAPSFAAGKVTYVGSGRVVSNAPVVKQ
jgi:prepilin-type N-terminal cleavage/methylation domain-containing protein